jgi:hydroxymethylpyrimidine pyrophosphatase-like HAD family hydrolase
MERRGLDAAAVMALGDEENDLPMFEAAGFSAAPANARETVRQAAGLVIGSNADDGAAVFLEEFFQLKGSSGNPAWVSPNSEINKNIGSS